MTVRVILVVAPLSTGDATGQPLVVVTAIIHDWPSQHQRRDGVAAAAARVKADGQIVG